MKVRLLFGLNNYKNEFECGHCHKRYVSGGLFARLEYQGVTVDIPVCRECVGQYVLFEGDIDLSQDNQSHPIGVA